MHRIFVTIHEPTVEQAVDRVRSLPAGDYGIELRADALGDVDVTALAVLRQRIERPLMYTRRSSPERRAATPQELRAAAEAGFDLIDLEISDTSEIPSELETYRERLLLSLHDFERVPAVEEIAAQLAKIARFKLAVTPRSLAENARLLALQEKYPEVSSIFGMGSAGLYSRIFSPFFGGTPMFVAPDADSVAAPGQLPLARALAILRAGASNPRHLFAVVGNPVAHSRSPEIHNEIFRRAGVRAAYSALQVESIGEVLDAMERQEPFSPDGISITAPFKRDAYAIASKRGYELGARAAGAEAVNTIVRDRDGRMAGYNTDVTGFVELLSRDRSGPVLIVGAGGTGRAAAVAVRELGLDGWITNRTSGRAAELARSTGLREVGWNGMSEVRPAVVVNTVPSASGWTPPASLFRSGSTLVVADYAQNDHVKTDELEQKGVRVFTGLDLLRAQAAGQARLFLEVADSSHRSSSALTVPELNP